MIKKIVLLIPLISALSTPSFCHTADYSKDLFLASAGAALGVLMTHCLRPKPSLPTPTPLPPMPQEPPAGDPSITARDSCLWALTHVTESLLSLYPGLKPSDQEIAIQIGKGLELAAQGPNRELLNAVRASLQQPGLFPDLVAEVRIICKNNNDLQAEVKHATETKDGTTDDGFEQVDHTS